MAVPEIIENLDELRALAPIAEGRTIKEVAFAVGASTYSVARWVKRSGQPRAGRRALHAA